MDLTWYWRRARQMSPTETARRAFDHARHTAWSRRQVRRGHEPDPGGRAWPRPTPTPLPPNASIAVPEPARRALLAAADELLEGRREILGFTRDDLRAPDWFRDPISGRRAPRERYAFNINHRSEQETGNVKQVWELSRHHHLTVLAAAWWCTGDNRYAEVVDRQLRSWWRENPFLSGVHWTSGIELGVRLIAWTWIRRLLDGWPGVADLFERNDDAGRQLAWHQEYLAAFPSHGSSANNHAIAEAAGQLTASCAFPWFAKSDRWRAQSQARLVHELERNTFSSGVNRELASDYHGFVIELALVAAVESEVSGHPLSADTWARVGAMVDAAYAIADERRRGPRQGDGDNGRALVVDGEEPSSWTAAMACGAAVLDPLDWWSTTAPTVESVLLGSLVAHPRREIAGRPLERRSHFADAGITLLRTAAGTRPEIWCRCDAGPHGHLSIAAHAHADALSIEVRHGGVDVLADPGTYCYHGEPEWRSYFRSTRGHNTLELDGVDQSRSGGPFLWLQQASSEILGIEAGPQGEIHCWSAQHDGYLRLGSPALHRRKVRLDTRAGRLEITDDVESATEHACQLAFHLGPAVSAHLRGDCAHLEWRTGCTRACAVLRLPARLEWTTHRGETDPPLGWYSAEFGSKEPTVTLLGRGRCGGSLPDLVTTLELGS